MLGSVIYHRIVLIRVIRGAHVNVWKTILAPVEVMVDKDSTENLNRHRTTPIILLDLGCQFCYQCFGPMIAVVLLIRRV